MKKSMEKAKQELCKKQLQLLRFCHEIAQVCCVWETSVKTRCSRVTHTATSFVGNGVFE